MSIVSDHQKAKPAISEDWLAVLIALFIFVLSLATFVGADVLGWAVTTAVWTDLAAALKPVSANFSVLPGWLSLVCTYVFLLVVLSCGAKLMGAKVREFARGFTLVFFLSYLCWMVGGWCAHRSHLESA